MKIPTERMTFAYAAAAALILLVFAAYMFANRSGGPAGSGIPLIGGPFTLVDQDGRQVTEANFRGRFMLIYFGYTYCPDVCPTTLTTMADAVRLLGADEPKVVPIFITVDPQRDTPDHLKMYVGYFHPRMVGLTGSAEQAAASAKAFRVYYAKVEDKEAPPDSDAYVMDHTSIVYLMGPDGRFLSNFGHGATPEQIAAKTKEFM